jgi:hypothetical protein
MCSNFTYYSLLSVPVAVLFLVVNIWVALSTVVHCQNFSKLLCLHFGTWDRSKEWSVSMPQGEDIMVSKT